VRDGLDVGPEDQSLWFYHEYLISDLVENVAGKAMAPHLNLEERQAYVSREIEDIKDLLEDYPDVKKIYEALIECTLATCQISGRSLESGAKDDVGEWLRKLRQLDPKRNGRWDDLESTLRSTT
jgi:geranylgeranyl transferase type-2 subunit alpha